MVRDKVTAAIRNEIMPILCIGETKHERDEGETKQVLHDQLMTALSNLTAHEVGKLVIAYEPVWAIGQVTAKPAQVEDAVTYIRRYIEDVFNESAAKKVRVLYGGDGESEVIHGLLAVQGVDGFLVGHGSLNYQTFSDIVEAAHRWQRNHEPGEEA